MAVVSLRSNVASDNTQRRLSQTTAELSRTSERLASGLRIVRASDDAAGLSISESLKADARIFHQGIRNFNDGANLLAIADSSLEQLSHIVTRLSELAEQSANGTLGAVQRGALDKEGQALSKEFTRLVRITSFNNLSLLDGTLGQIRLQGGVGANGGIVSGVGGATGNNSLNEIFSGFGSGGEDLKENALADLNGDGNLDLIEGGGVAALTVRLGNGDGTFRSPQNTTTVDAQLMKVADLNGDGILDILSGDNIRGYSFLGRGDGTFLAPRSFAFGTSTNDYTLDDVNGDGKVDLLIADNGVRIRFGNGNGTFGAATSYTMGPGASYMVRFVDLNGDGVKDLLSSGDGGSGCVAIRFGAGSGTFGAAVSYAMNQSSALAVSTGDLNNDGFVDIFTYGDGGSDDEVIVRFGSAAGTFTAVKTISTQIQGAVQSAPSNFYAGDLNGDGHIDFAVGGRDIAVIYGNGNGSFLAAQSYATNIDGVEGLAVGDINNDGVADIAVDGYESGGPSAQLRIYLSGTKEGTAALLSFDLSTQAGARQAIPIFRRKLDQLSAQRGKIGALQSRVGFATSTLQTTVENEITAGSRLTDVDVAEESSRFVRLRILQGGSAAILSQANQQPQLALTLLRNAG